MQRRNKSIYQSVEILSNSTCKIALLIIMKFTQSHSLLQKYYNLNSLFTIKDEYFVCVDYLNIGRYNYLLESYAINGFIAYKILF